MDGPQRIGVPSLVTPMAPAGEQNAPGWTPCWTGSTVVGAGVGAPVVGCPGGTTLGTEAVADDDGIRASGFGDEATTVGDAATGDAAADGVVKTGRVGLTV